MKYLGIALFFLLSATTAAGFTPTAQQIKEAEHIRAAARSMGLDKEDSGEFAARMGGMKNVQQNLTEKRREALACLFRKGQFIQFDAPIEVFARYLNDDAFEKEMTAKHQAECGL